MRFFGVRRLVGHFLSFPKSGDNSPHPKDCRPLKRALGFFGMSNPQLALWANGRSSAFADSTKARTKVKSKAPSPLSRGKQKR